MTDAATGALAPIIDTTGLKHGSPADVFPHTGAGDQSRAFLVEPHADFRDQRVPQIIEAVGFGHRSEPTSNFVAHPRQLICILAKSHVAMAGSLPFRCAPLQEWGPLQ
jgi:hypothetical protein